MGMTEEHHQTVAGPGGIEVTPQQYLCFTAEDVRQNADLIKLRHQMELLEAGRGALNAGSIRTILSIVAVAMSLGTAISSMWLQTSTEPTRKALSLLQADHEVLIARVGEDEARLNGDISVIEDKLEVQSNQLSETPSREDVAQSVNALSLVVQANEGQFTRQINGKITDGIKRNEADIKALERIHRANN